jgi:hypothetical protein
VDRTKGSHDGKTESRSKHRPLGGQAHRRQPAACGREAIDRPQDRRANGGQEARDEAGCDEAGWNEAGCAENRCDQAQCVEAECDEAECDQQRRDQAGSTQASRARGEETHASPLGKRRTNASQRGDASP